MCSLGDYIGIFGLVFSVILFLFQLYVRHRQTEAKKHGKAHSIYNSEIYQKAASVRAMTTIGVLFVIFLVSFLLVSPHRCTNQGSVLIYTLMGVLALAIFFRMFNKYRK